MKKKDLEKAGLEKKLEYYQSQFNHYHTLAEKVTLDNDRLKAKVAEQDVEIAELKALEMSHGEACVHLKAENAELHRDLLMQREDACYLLRKEISRLSASLARAHEALEPFSRQYQKYGKHGMLSHQTYVNAVKALHDKDGTHALDRWKKMEVVVEAAKNEVSQSECFCLNAHDGAGKPICEYCQLKKAIEALDDFESLDGSK